MSTIRIGGAAATFGRNMEFELDRIAKPVDAANLIAEMKA